MVVSFEAEFPELHEEEPRQTWFWVEPDFVTEGTEETKIVGEMRDAPPLALIEELSTEFPGLTFDCICTTNHECTQHWRLAPGGEQFELIESLSFDPRTDERFEYFLKEGEDALFG